MSKNSTGILDINDWQDIPEDNGMIVFEEIIVDGLVNKNISRITKCRNLFEILYNNKTRKLYFYFWAWQKIKVCPAVLLLGKCCRIYFWCNNFNKVFVPLSSVFLKKELGVG